MRQSDQTLLQQLRITEFSISARKALFQITSADESVLKNAKQFIERAVEPLVERFYKMQTSIDEIALVIGDADTLHRLKVAQTRYIHDLFSGYYDLEYVNNRLRIGLVHKRIGVEPKLYLAAVQTLRGLLHDLIEEVIADQSIKMSTVAALDKLLMFDVSLVFDTYIRSMINEIEISKAKSDAYASILEEKVRVRTIQLEIQSRTDPLTGLLNVRHLEEMLTQALRAAQRRLEPVSIAYIDVNDFKTINDTEGHQRGDEVLRVVAESLKAEARLEDDCFRYGGDEFCIVMANCTLAGANAWKERLLKSMQTHENCPSLSIGIVQTGPEEYLSAGELIRQADETMYKVKKSMKERT